jgi:hypothetical protein
MHDREQLIFAWFTAEKLSMSIELPEVPRHMLKNKAAMTTPAQQLRKLWNKVTEMRHKVAFGRIAQPVSSDASEILG